MSSHPDVAIVRSLLNAIDDECEDGREWQFMPHALAALDRIESALMGTTRENLMPMLNTVTEQELAARAIAPRITETDLEAAINSEHYFTAQDGRNGALNAGTYSGREVPSDGDADLLPLGLLTICVLVLENGYTVTGTSACASPANFDADIGKRLARRDAVRQVWPLLGFQLRDRIHHAPALHAAAVALAIDADTCEHNAPIHADGGNQAQAELCRANAASYRAAIARLVP